MGKKKNLSDKDGKNEKGGKEGQVKEAKPRKGKREAEESREKKNPITFVRRKRNEEAKAVRKS